IQTKFRDEIRPRFGLMRAREFVMKDAYSFDLDEAGLDASYEAMRLAYHKICERIGFHYRAVEADSGAIGGSGSQEFMVLADTGEDTIIYCDQCEYAANQERAAARLEQFEQDTEERPMEAVLGEGLIGVEPLAEFLGIPVWKTTKTLLFEANDQLVGVMVRGDCDVNEIKVSNFLGGADLKLVAPERIKEMTGAVAGYAGPIGLPDNVRLIADVDVNNRVNFECGANKTDYHNINVNFGRDLPLPEFGDFKLAQAGYQCPHCEGTLKAQRGIEVGHIFKLGTKYSEALKCVVPDGQGKQPPAVMGCYGIGVSRMAAACVEQNHDDRGMIWPIHVAPYHVHLLCLTPKDEAVVAQCEQLYQTLQDAGVEVLFDDRKARPGEKFSDADLMGMPIRLAISKRTLEQNCIEVKLRKEADNQMLSQDQTLQLIKDLMA
ncbi:MAG: proline--tRNA ligase, partial [Phycisphaeraceae bacterium]|nr:proline--tRNA ligase [Phycisphaeraceae bacterium]